MGPIRILQVFGRMDRGGAESMIMNIYRNIDRSKVQFDFVVHTDDKCHFDEEIYRLGGEIYHVPKYTIKNHFSYIKAWNEFFKKHHEYKIIHGHMYSIASVYLSVAKKHGLITIAHSHNTSNGTGMNKIIRQIYRMPINKCSDYKFACGIEAGKWLFRTKDFKVINNAIDVKQYKYNEEIAREYRAKLNISDKFVIGHVGRFQEQKNHEFLIDVFYEIQKQREDAVLLLVGDGGLRPQIEEKVEKLGINEKVIFTGVRFDVPDLMQAMDMFLFPSHYEGLSVVLIEVQAAGLPIYTSSTVAKETDITKTIKFINLEDGATGWTKIILQSGCEREKSNGERIVESGYDIKQSGCKMQELYLQIYK